MTTTEPEIIGDYIGVDSPAVAHGSSMDTRYEKVIAGIGAIGTVAGIFAGVGGLFFTGYQIQEAANQLQASTLYGIKKDARELFKEISSDEALYSYVFSPNPSTTQFYDLKVKGQNANGQVIQFYSAVYDQVNAGSIDEKHVRSLTADFCRFARLPSVTDRAKRVIESPSYSEEFRSAMADCLKGG